MDSPRKTWLRVCVLSRSVSDSLQHRDCSPPGSSPHRVTLAGILQRAAVSSSKGSSRPRDQTCISSSSWIDRWILTTEPRGKLKTQLEDSKRCSSGLKKKGYVPKRHVTIWGWGRFYETNKSIIHNIFFLNTTFDLNIYVAVTVICQFNIPTWWIKSQFQLDQQCILP